MYKYKYVKQIIREELCLIIFLLKKYNIKVTPYKEEIKKNV